MPFELPAEIASQIPPEHLSHQSVQKYNSPAELLKGHIELDSYRGRSISLPNGEAKPEEIEKWRSDQNQKLKDRGLAIAPLKDLRGSPPESPDKYEFKFPDGVKPEDIANDTVLKEYRAFAHSKGMSNQEAADLLNWFAEKAAPEIAKKFAPPEVDFVHGDSVKTLMESVFKQETTQALDEYKKNVDILGVAIPELKDALNEGVAPFGEKWMMLGDHPAVVKLVNHIAALTRPDFGGSVNSGVEMGKDQFALIEEANDIMRNPDNPKYKSYWASDPKTVEYVNSLYTRAHPGDVTI
jgi:hypothetical protein